MRVAQWAYVEEVVIARRYVTRLSDPVWCGKVRALPAMRLTPKKM